MFHPSRLFPLLCALTAPLLVQLVWLLHNTQLPISDSTGSLLAAYRLSKLGLDGLWWEFFKGLYTIRDWRPTALCLVEMPFCLISGGNLMFTASAMTLVSNAISVTYVYRLLRLALSPYAAALGAAMLGLMPVMQWPATYFGFTETPFLAAMLATFYHLLQVNDFKNRRQCCLMAIAATLAFMLRPVETLFHFLPVLAFCIWLGYRRAAITFAEIYMTVTAGFVFASLLALAGWWPNGLFVPPQSAIFDGGLQGKMFLVAASAILLTTVFLVLFLIMRPALRAKQQTYLLYTITIISTGVYLWYASFMTELMQWIYITNLGELSNITATRTAFEKLSFFFFSVGAIPLTLIALLALANRKAQSQILLPLLAVIPIPLLTPFFTCQYSQRKMTVIFTCLLVVLLSFALQKAAARRFIALLALCQCAGVAWVSMGYEHSAPLEKLIGLRIIYPDMVTTRPNPHDTIVAFMDESAKRYGYHSISLPILAGDFVPRIADPFLLHILTSIKAPELDATLPHIIADTAAEYTKPQALFGGDAFLVAPEHKLAFTQAEAEHYRTLAKGAFLPSDKSAYEILALHAAGKLETLGVHKRACTVVAPTEVEICLYDYSR